MRAVSGLQEEPHWAKMGIFMYFYILAAIQSLIKYLMVIFKELKWQCQKCNLISYFLLKFIV